MIDTIKLWIASEQFPNTDMLSELPLLLDEGTISYHQNKNKDYITGRIDNFLVRIHVTGMSIEGSLSRYYTGNNMNTLSYGDLTKAFDKLSKRLNIAIDKSKINRLDIADNYIVDYPVFNYYSFLGDLSRFNRTEQNNGIYYQQTNFVLCIYDKVNERKMARESVLDEYNGLNVLRYEFRFAKKFGINLSRKPVFVADLLDKEFFKELIGLYVSRFQEIYKHGARVCYPDLYVMSRSVFWRHVKYAGIQSLGGEKELIEAIRKSRKGKVVKSSSDATRIIQDIKQSCENSQVVSKSLLIEELEVKVLEKSKQYLS